MTPLHKKLLGALEYWIIVFCRGVVVGLHGCNGVVLASMKLSERENFVVTCQKNSFLKKSNLQIAYRHLCCEWIVMRVAFEAKKSVGYSRRFQQFYISLAFLFLSSWVRCITRLSSLQDGWDIQVSLIVLLELLFIMVWVVFDKKRWLN